MKNKIDKLVNGIVCSGSSDNKHQYMMLGRLEADCKYYLGNGGRNPKYLWAGDVETHIGVMRGLWNSFSKDGKPEWMTLEDIEDYEKRMTA